MSQQPPPGWGQAPQQPPQQGPPTQPQWGPPTQPQWAPPPPPKPKKPWYKRPLPVIGAIVAVLLLLGGLFGDDNQPNGTATRQTSPPTTQAPNATEPAATEPEPTEPPTTAAPGAPRPQTISGRGKTATKPFRVTDGMAIFRFQHRGSSNFIVGLLTNRGEEIDNLVNEIGTTNGATARPLEAARYLFNVEADGPWSIRIEQPRPGSGRGLPTTAKGRGHSVAGPFQATGAGVRFELRHRGESNFIVDVLDVDGQSIGNLSNEIGSFEGSMVGDVPEGVFWLNVQADGSWSVAMRPL